MRKRILTLFTLAAAMMLSACGGDDISSDVSGVSALTAEADNSIDETQEYRRPIDLEELYGLIIDYQPEGTEELVMLPEERDSDFVNAQYGGLTLDEYNQFVVYAPPVAGYPCEIVMVEAKYDIGADRAEEVFLDRIDKAANDTDYPDNAVGWANNAEVHREGFYVALIVLPDGYELPYSVFDLISE